MNSLKLLPYWWDKPTDAETEKRRSAIAAEVLQELTWVELQDACAEGWETSDERAEAVEAAKANDWLVFGECIAEMVRAELRKEVDHRMMLWRNGYADDQAAADSDERHSRQVDDDELSRHGS